MLDLTKPEKPNTLDPQRKIAAFSGGKDSVAMALGMKDRGEDFTLLFTATGNELPELIDHVRRMADLLQAPLVMPPGPKLEELILSFQALPNHRQRWCTRMIKIIPCIAYLKQHPGSTLCVGLRADEESREGLYGDYATYRYPLREWGWKESDVWKRVHKAKIKIPRRSDCAWCYGQRIGEWYVLWRDHRAIFDRGADLEAQVGYTFRSAKRDTWPASMKELGKAFAGGRLPRPQDMQDDSDEASCRVCRI
jgi:hypothetical protein